MKFWTTACNKDNVVIYNVAQEYENLGDALSAAVDQIPAEFHDSIIITDMENNNLFPCEVKEGANLCAYVSQWNKRKQCFTVRVTAGLQNLQWLDNNERAKVSVVYREDFKSSAKAKEYAKSINAEIYPGWD